MSKGNKAFLTIISLMLLCTALLLPMHSNGGGILIWKSDYNFVRIIGDSIMVKGTFSLWVVHMTLGVFLPAAIMLAAALMGIRWVYGLSNTLGILIWFFNLYRYAQKSGYTALFDVNKTDIAIGSWLAIFFFLISSLVLLCTKKKQDNEPTETEEKNDNDKVKDKDKSSHKRNGKDKKKGKQKDKTGYCPYCGIRLRGNTSRCPRCHKKL